MVTTVSPTVAMSGPSTANSVTVSAIPLPRPNDTTEAQPCHAEDTSVADVATDALAALRSADLFQDCDGAHVDLLLDRQAVVPSGTVLLRQGRAGADAYLIVGGEAKVDQNGRTIAIVGAGSIVGELSLLDGGPRTATVTAVTRLELVVLDRRSFCRVLAADLSLLSTVLRSLAGRVRIGVPAAEWGHLDRRGGP